MLPSLAHLAVAVVLGALSAAVGAVWARDRRSYTLIVLVVSLGLTYDNAVLGVGRWLGEGDLLRALSFPRFLLHALLTPLLVIAAFGAARAFGLRWARGAPAHAGFCLVASAFVAWGLVTDVALLELDAQHEAGVLSYGNAAAGAPVPAIATIVVLLAVGALLWRGAGWAWLAVGAAVMFVASGLGAVSGLLTNIGELTLAATLLATDAEAGRRCRAARSPAAPARRRSRPAPV